MYLELTPLQALVWCAEDVINTWAEILPCDGQTREPWVLDLERLKEKLRSAVHFILQTLRAVSTYHHNYNKASYRCLKKMKSSVLSSEIAHQLQCQFSHCRENSVHLQIEARKAVDV